MRLLMKLAKEKQGAGMFHLVETMLKKTKVRILKARQSFGGKIVMLCAKYFEMAGNQLNIKYPCNKLQDLCVSVCVCVPKDLANRLADMVLLYRVASHQFLGGL